MRIHLVRHAHAGSRRDWDDDDDLRPLSDKGWAQAELIADDLVAAGVDQVWSSHYVRCVQTVEPLANRLGLPVVRVDLLAEGGSGGAGLDALLATAAQGHQVVASSHGDVIPEIIRAAVRRGADLDGPWAPRKGDRYQLEVTDGTVTRITHVPVPTVDD